MAIIFTPKDGTAFTIGGVESGPTGDGVAGPFANLSISKEIVRQDSIVLGAKWTINITGTALIPGTASHLARGVRQGKLFDKTKQLIFKDINKQGTLDIDAYGGTSELLFKFATLVSVEAAEQDESSMGTQNQAYSFTFESSDGDGTLVAEEGRKTALKWIESFEESWDVSVQDGGTSQIDSGGTPFKTYTVSHSLSAQAVLGSHDSSDEMSFTIAKTFVEDRLIDDPMLESGDASPQDERKNKVTLDMPHTNYVAYSHIRQRQQSIAAGSYSVTDTWMTSRYPATMTVEYGFNLDPAAEYNTVDVSVSAQGLDSTHPETDINTDKYANALVQWATLKSAAKNGAPTFYALAYPGSPFTLRTVERSASESHNKTDGNLTFSCTFDDAKINYPNAVSETLNVTYDNKEGKNQIVVIIPVLEKPDGPVIQDMCTTNEKAVSVSLDLQMDRETRTFKPGDGTTTDPTTIVDAYKPASATTGPYQRTKSESWNPYTGSYNLSIEWVYI